MPGILDVLYRGPLASCNYACDYCPFAKRVDSASQLQEDRVALDSFRRWIEHEAEVSFRLLFTPWGEALIRPWYRETLASLSRLDHVRRVAVQTNGAWPVAWLDDADLDTLALWITFHPSEVDLASFAERMALLCQRGVRFSVGAVGIPTNLAALEELRARLDPGVYLWVNAEEGRSAYADEDIRRLTAIDPEFPTSLAVHASLGRACRTGSEAITVDGRGDIRRCHFVDRVLTSIHDPGWRRQLRPRPCPNATCTCHIGYVHLQHLGLQRVYGEGLLERIPAARPGQRR